MTKNVPTSALSPCCNARIVDALSLRNIEDKTGQTNWFLCENCHKPCDPPSADQKPECKCDPDDLPCSCYSLVKTPKPVVHEYGIADHETGYIEEKRKAEMLPAAEALIGSDSLRMCHKVPV